MTSAVIQSTAPPPRPCYLFIAAVRAPIGPPNVINVMLLHQTIIKCQVMPWQQNAMAGSQWGEGNGGGSVSGGTACWEGSMAHLTPACPLLIRHDRLHLLHTPHVATPSCCEMSARGRTWWLMMSSWRRRASKGALLLVFGPHQWPHHSPLMVSWHQILQAETLNRGPSRPINCDLHT